MSTVIQALHIGDGNRADTVRISDTRQDGDSLMVTVREMIGGYGSWVGGRGAAMSAMRSLARRAVFGARSTSACNEWYSNGQHHVTFEVSA